MLLAAVGSVVHGCVDLGKCVVHGCVNMGYVHGVLSEEETKSRNLIRNLIERNKVIEK